MTATLAVIDGFAVGQPALLTRFKAARLQAAWNVLAEDPATTNHAAHILWAKKIFTSYEADVSKEYLWHLSHTNIQTAGSGVTDANLVAAVVSFVDAWST